MSVLFLDIGGVLITNGWDRIERTAAAERFKLDWNDFEERHQSVLRDFETGNLSLEEYLDHVIFYTKRSFTRDEFKQFVYAQARPLPESLALLGRLAKATKCLISSLNNESRDLNAFRIEKFHLRDYFDVFLSSCYLGVRKPDEQMYRRALEIVQRRPEECVFVDDRELNLEPARKLGIKTVQFHDAAQLERELRGLGIAIAAAENRA